MNHHSSSPILYLIDDEDEDEEQDLPSEDETNKRPSTEIKRKNSYSLTNFSSKRSRIDIQSEPIVLDSDESNDERNLTNDYESFDWTRDSIRSTRICSESMNFSSTLPLISNSQTRITNSNRSTCETMILPLPTPMVSPNSTFQTNKSNSNLCQISTFPSNSSLEPENFVAFRDSFVYRCNYCKFLTKAKSDLLQHVLTHIFSCSYCSFFSYSHSRLEKHQFDEHRLEMFNQGRTKEHFDLISVQRNSNGSFSLINEEKSSNEHFIQSKKSFPSPRLIEIVAQCVKSLVNSVVSNVENNGRPKLFFELPNSILKRIFPDFHIETMLNYLKLKNKYENSKRKSEEFRSFSNRRSAVSNFSATFDSIFTKNKFEPLTSNSTNKEDFLDDRTVRCLKKRHLRFHLNRDSSSIRTKQIVNENSNCSNSESFSPLTNVIVLD